MPQDIDNHFSEDHIHLFPCHPRQRDPIEREDVHLIVFNERKNKMQVLASEKEECRVKPTKSTHDTRTSASYRGGLGTIVARSRSEREGYTEK